MARTRDSIFATRARVGGRSKPEILGSKNSAQLLRKIE
jgi:hypothetical protein